MRLHQPAFATIARRPYVANLWDVLTFGLLFAVLILLAHGGRETLAPLTSLDVSPVSLDPAMLPEYAVRSTMRMLAAIVASIIFSLAYGALAAKSRRAEIVLIPLLDILQSVPVLGFLSFTVVAFMALFPGQVLFYQSLKTLPSDLDEASRSFRLSTWQRFWRLEVPFAMPGLVWNTMMSMSGGWFFVVASEAISVGNTTVALPGIGSYLALAIEKQSLAAVGWAVLAMLVVILLYDQLLFRPIVAWAEKFRVEQTAAATVPRSWFLDAVRRARLFRWCLSPFTAFLQGIPRTRLQLPAELPSGARAALSSAWADRAWLAQPMPCG